MGKNLEIKHEKRYRRHKRIRSKVSGTAGKPRLCVFRSSKHIYAQLIDDEKSKTLISASDSELKKQKSRASRSDRPQKTKVKENSKSVKALTGKQEIACEVGKLIAKKALESKVEKVVFDRGGYKYHGRVKALAEGAREGGLKF